MLLLSCCWGPPTLPLPHPLPLPLAPITVPLTVDVALPHRAPEFAVQCPGGGTWLDAAGEVLAASEAGPWRLTSTGGRLLLDGVPRETGVVVLKPSRRTFRLGEHAYRGQLRVSALPEGRFAVRNRVATEDYLCGVVGREVYPSWKPHALQAQAVAARTYMIYALTGRSYLTAADMAYWGVDGEHASTSNAVRSTRGIVLAYRGAILPAFFHSTCGGRTTSADKFSDTLAPIPPLSGVPCGWCAPSRTFRWRCRLRADRIRDALKRGGLADVQELTSLETLEAEPDGYARWILVNGQVRLGAYAFRSAVGPGVLKSTNFVVTRTGDGFEFEGRGHGHGVGMCQWGAEGLARAGRNWQQILEHYYPGAEIRMALPPAPPTS